jgi:hypothetical protein
MVRWLTKWDGQNAEDAMRTGTSVSKMTAFAEKLVEMLCR